MAEQTGAASPPRDLRSLAGEVLLRHGFKVAAADQRVQQCEVGVRNAADSYDRHRGGRLASARLGDREHELRQAKETRAALDRDPARLLALAVLADTEPSSGTTAAGATP